MSLAVQGPRRTGHNGEFRQNINFCCTTKWLSYAHVYSFAYSFPLWLITGSQIQLPVQYTSRTLLSNHSTHNSLHLLTPDSNCRYRSLSFLLRHCSQLRWTTFNQRRITHVLSERSGQGQDERSGQGQACWGMPGHAPAESAADTPRRRAGNQADQSGANTKPSPSNQEPTRSPWTPITAEPAFSSL